MLLRKLYTRSFFMALALATPAFGSTPIVIDVSSKPVAPDVSTTAVEIKTSGIKVRGNHESIALGDIQKYIQGFYVKTEGECASTKIVVKGLVHPACAPHLRIELDDPNTDESGAWAIRIEKANLVDSETGLPQVAGDTADVACKPELTRQCKRRQEGVPASKNDCVELSSITGAENFDTILHKDGEIQYRVNDEKNNKHPFALESFPEAMEDIKRAPVGRAEKGEPILGAKFESCSTERRRLRAETKAKTIAHLLATCKEAADKGEAGAIDEFKSALVEAFGENGLTEHKDLIKELEKKAYENVLKEFSSKIGRAKTLAELNDLIDEVETFARDDKQFKDPTADSVKLLLEIVISANAMPGATNEEFAAKAAIVERAQNIACKLEPKNEKLRNMRDETKLLHAKAGAGSGSDKFYNEKFRKELFDTYRSLGQRMQRSKDPATGSLYNQYTQELMPRMVPVPQYNPYTGRDEVIGYIPGTSFDQTYYQARNEANKPSLDEQFKLYKARLMNGPNPTGAPYNTAAGGIVPNSAVPQGF